jgi:hypothetical protein
MSIMDEFLKTFAKVKKNVENETITDPIIIERKGVNS